VSTEGKTYKRITYKTKQIKQTIHFKLGNSTKSNYLQVTNILFEHRKLYGKCLKEEQWGTGSM